MFLSTITKKLNLKNVSFKNANFRNEQELQKGDERRIHADERRAAGQHRWIQGRQVQGTDFKGKNH